MSKFNINFHKLSELTLLKKSMTSLARFISVHALQKTFDRRTPKSRTFSSLLLMLVLAGIICTSSCTVALQQDKHEPLTACHRCGMEIQNSEHTITAYGVSEGLLPECCVPCAIMDILELADDKSGMITAFDDLDDTKISISIKNGALERITPPDTVIIMGGICMKNKIFVNKGNSRTFLKNHDWATEEMLKTVPDTFAKLKKRVVSYTYCALCGAPLKDNEKTYFSIMTGKHRRFVFCNVKCGIFGAHRLEGEEKYVVSKDFSTGQLFNAKKGFYVHAATPPSCSNRLVQGFISADNAAKFQSRYGGEIITYENLEKHIAHDFQPHKRKDDPAT